MTSRAGLIGPWQIANRFPATPDFWDDLDNARSPAFRSASGCQSRSPRNLPAGDGLSEVQFSGRGGVRSRTWMTCGFTPTASRRSLRSRRAQTRILKRVLHRPVYSSTLATSAKVPLQIDCRAIPVLRRRSQPFPGPSPTPRVTESGPSIGVCDYIPGHDRPVFSVQLPMSRHSDAIGETHQRLYLESPISE